jgi:beta-lactamase class A
MPSRRFFMGSAAALSVAPIAATTRAETQSLGTEILSLFDGLPGRTGIKIWAPDGTKSGQQLLIAHNAHAQMFVGSAIKTFVLAEALIQVDSPDIISTLQNTQLALDASVWSLDSQTFNPPNLSGIVSERTAIEAMIIHSDNTGTDMMLAHTGPDNVRNFISQAGLRATAIPDSTRVFFGYLLGAPDYKTFTWAETVAATDDPIVNPPLNDVVTLASSANDFVSFYSRALQGKFFKHPETLNEFRRILTLGDAIYLVPFPLGASAFCKGGSIDVPGFHCLSVPGGMFVDDRWVFFAFTINWDAPAETDPATGAAFAAGVSEALTRVLKALSG